MDLILEKHSVKAARLGGSSGLAGGMLTVDPDALSRHLLSSDDRLTRVDVGLGIPGEQTRIVCVKDVVQPRIKTAGDMPGTGRLDVLDNVGVVTCGPIVGFQEGIIDMSGPGAVLSPFSELFLVVLDVFVGDETLPHEHEKSVRNAGLRAAEFIARICAGREADEVQTVSWREIPSTSMLPRIAYVYLVLSQGLLHDTYVFGRDAKQGLPLSVDPRVAFDNAIVSGNCVSACDKNTTFHHQNNPVIAELLRGHGSDWNFVGTVVGNETTRLAGKAQAAKAVADLVAGMQADGAIVSKEGFGNPDADLMMIVRELEAAEVRTVAITDEFAGTDGGSQSLADSTPEADAVITTGNANERIELPAMANTLGPLPDVTRLAGGYPHTLRADGSMEVELQAIMGATNQLGFGRLSCREI